MIRIEQYDYEGLIQSYLAQDRPLASTASNRMSYHNTVLYSYNSILAKMSEVIPNVLYINKHIAECSNTTKKHTGLLQRKALSWNIFVIDLNIPFSDNLQTYWEDIELLIKRYQRARTLKPKIKQALHKLIHTTQHFAELHGLDPTIPDHIMKQLFVNQLLT